MTMWSRMAPSALQKILESYADMINLPRIGTYDKYMWPSCQLNLAEPQHSDDGKCVVRFPLLNSTQYISERPLGETNGKSGHRHVDGLDAHTHYSSATVLSDLPVSDGWEPGRMHFTALGVYTTLDSLYVVE